MIRYLPLLFVPCLAACGGDSNTTDSDLRSDVPERTDSGKSDEGSPGTGLCDCASELETLKKQVEVMGEKLAVVESRKGPLMLYDGLGNELGYVLDIRASIYGDREHMFLHREIGAPALYRTTWNMNPGQGSLEKTTLYFKSGDCTGQAYGDFNYQQSETGAYRCAGDELCIPLESEHIYFAERSRIEPFSDTCIAMEPSDGLSLRRMARIDPPFPVPIVEPVVAK